MATIRVRGVNEVELRKLEVALQDDEWVESLAELENAAAVQKALADKGIILTAEEVENVRVAFANATSGNEELNEADLDNVAGGSIWIAEVTYTGKKWSFTFKIPW